jgi:hypothetical protein
MGVCVKNCPTGNNEAIECMTTEMVNNCNSNKVKSNMYPTVNVAGYCFPKKVDALSTEVKESW